VGSDDHTTESLDFEHGAMMAALLAVTGRSGAGCYRPGTRGGAASLPDQDVGSALILTVKPN
jgi:hypothetical protein